MNPAKDDACTTAVERLVRAHNLAILAVFIAALGCVMVVQATHLFPSPPRWIWATRAVLVLLPLASLSATALYTRRLIAGLGAAPPIGALTAAFVRSKRFSLVSLMFCGLAAAGSLIVGHTVVDVALAGVSFALLLATRPSAAGLAMFAHIAHETAPEGDEA